ncbi:TPR-like protein [Dioscorea alata]|uniref:TPR-like protein n=3 Tax=Dioscorea alata TaxID=55571 RepID=A0ACB7WAL2_DIOAL|nr:TPR-like protein [Dioscorea alata]KAH7684807.1 TPR-like protein [Dioscorea alata]KAH7684808.1 TPR-like protein [Dioscorea alata]
MRWPGLIPLFFPQPPSLLRSIPLSDPYLSSLSPHLSASSISSALHFLPFPSAFRLFLWSSFHRHLRSFDSHNIIISTLVSSPDDSFPSAWQVLSDFHSSGNPVHPAAFTVLISAYSAADLPEKAVETFSRMQDFGSRPNTFTYNTLLRVLIEKDVILLSMAVYNLMLKSDCLPNSASYGILIDGLCKAGKNEDALKLFDEMLQRRVPPNAVVYTVFLTSLCGAGKIEDAMRLLGSMKEKNCPPDDAVYNAMLSGFCKAGRIDEAFEYLKAFQEDGFVLGLSGYSCLIDGLFRAERFEDACSYYKEMLTKSLVPDCVLYTIMIRGYLEAGMVEEAFSFLSEMTDKGVVPDTFCYNTLIKGLCDSGHLDRARSLRLQISKHNCFPDSATCTIMICGLCKEGMIHEAQEIFDEMGKHGCAPTVMTFNALINGLCKAGQLKKANYLFHKMEMGRNPSLFLRLSQGTNRVRDSHSLQKLVEDLCESGLVLKAYKLLRDIIDSGVVPDVVTYNILINGFCKEGDLNGALNLFKRLQLEGHMPDDVTYSTLIDGLLKVRRKEDSSLIYQHMLRNGYATSLSICATHMRTMCREKRVSQAVNFWLDHLLQDSALSDEKETIKLVQKQFEQEYLEEAIRTLIEMDQRRNSVNSFPYTIWLIGYCQARAIDKAVKIFSLLVEYKIDVTPPSCVLLINGLCRKGKLGSALNVMLYSLDKGYLFMQPVGNRLLKRLCIYDKKRAACELARRMHLTGYDMDLYLRDTTKALLYN